MSTCMLGSTFLCLLRENRLFTPSSLGEIIAKGMCYIDLKKQEGRNSIFHLTSLYSYIKPPLSGARRLLFQCELPVAVSYFKKHLSVRIIY